MSKLDNNYSWLNHVKIHHLLAGISGGVTSTLVLHPLDVVKIRFAVHDGKANTIPRYSGIANAFSTIFKEEGVRGLYKGVTPNVWGAGASWGLYFFFYNAIKRKMSEGDPDRPLKPAQHLLGASEAGIMTLLITNPLWVVKTRLCLQFSTKNEYAGMFDALVKIYRNEGIVGYYRGLVPGIFGVSHGAIQFMVYEELKNRYNEMKGNAITTKLSTTQYLAFAAISKLMAAGLTYPYQVVRARLQNQHLHYSGALHCIKQTYKYERLRGFYKGLGPNLIRVTPATMITFWTYENVSHFLSHVH